MVTFRYSNMTIEHLAAILRCFPANYTSVASSMIFQPRLMTPWRTTHNFRCLPSTWVPPSNVCFTIPMKYICISARINHTVDGCEILQHQAMVECLPHPSTGAGFCNHPQSGWIIMYSRQTSANAWFTTLFFQTIINNKQSASHHHFCRWYGYHSQMVSWHCFTYIIAPNF